MIRLPRLLLAAGLLVALGSPARAADPDKLLPADADAVVVVNLKQIIGSDVVKKYALEQVKQLLEGQDVKKLLGDLGLDPLKDIEQIVAASSETKFGPQTEPKIFLIAHGKFDAEKVYKTAEAESKRTPDRISIVKDGKVSLIKIQPDAGQTTLYAAVADERTLVAGTDKKSVTEAMNIATGARATPVKKELADLFKKADDKASVFAAVLLKGKLGDLKIPGGGNLPIKLDDIEKALPNIDSATVTVKIGEDVNVEATIGMKDKEAATDMHKAVDDLLKQLKPLVQLAGAAEPRAKPLTDVLNSVKTASKDKDVSISGIITGANIGQMINPAP